MMNQLPVEQCRFCGGRDIRVGWQSDALVTFKRNGLLGNRIKFLICGTCGAVLYQCVAEPHRFPVNSMYDYMKALQRQFETDSRLIQDLNDEVNRTYKVLSSRLAKEDRKLLLRLVDMEDHLRGQATLHSFTCGYRLACGIHRELAEEPMYSFAKEEEERACRKAQANDEDDTET